MPDTSQSAGNAAQVRMIAEQLGDVFLEKMMRHSPPPPSKAEIPPILKVAGGIVTALMTAAIIGVCFWIITTLSDMKDTVARMDERLALTSNNTGQRIDQIDRRVTQLEALHRGDRP
ncbi:hypothetical protein [Stakelama pacifica]|uniref:Uncharacterized protein n=1 Tax=Stakelama pacifica TaxID=517720 RepID=A0A4R6FQG8_9SPHN|nr:hypothetical protein [Stakelama pacifica]TDN82965.1 hypothetical protein EV664_105163 [Stakelama pacifica]GGO95060.1 hypothetical protein GCM10011329_18350 [Stakelama pacifica]